MSEFEDPRQFDIRKKIGDIEIMFSDLMEISQGGPEIGNLSINRKMLEGRYGGPILCKNEFVYAPFYVRKFFETGFRLAKIDIKTLEIKYLTRTENLIFLDKVQGNRIYFFDNMDKTNQRYCEF